MAITTYGTKLAVKGSKTVNVKIKSFPDFGAAPTAIEVTTLADDVQKFIPGIKGMAAMEFTANYDAGDFKDLGETEGEECIYTINFGKDTTDCYSFKGKHTVIIVGGGLNAVVDMKVVVVPSTEIQTGDTYTEPNTEQQ